MDEEEAAFARKQDFCKGKFYLERVTAEQYDAITFDFVEFTVRWKNGDDMVFETAPTAPIIDMVKMDLVQDPQIDIEGIVLVYQNKAVAEGDTPKKLGMKSGDLIHGRYTECMQLLFAREDDDGESVDPVIVRVKPENWAKARVGEILDQYAKQVGEEAGETTLQFSSRGVRLLSCVEMASPASLGLKDKDTIKVLLALPEAEETSPPRKQKRRSKNKKAKKPANKRKKVPTSQWREHWGFLLNGLEAEGTDGALHCNHGCEMEAMEPSHIVWKFIDTFLDVVLMNETDEKRIGSAIFALRATHDAQEEVWMYEKLRKKAIQILIQMGANAALANVNLVEIPLAILYLESFHETSRFSRGSGLAFGTMRVATLKRWAKLEDGGKREAIRFLSKRISCSCLDALYSEAKALQTKTGACCYCNKTVDRSSLQVCSKCHFAEYCSRECQEKHWTEGEHKGQCKIMRAGDDNLVVKFFAGND